MFKVTSLLHLSFSNAPWPVTEEHENSHDTNKGEGRASKKELEITQEKYEV